jgi:hypothetical protein
MKCEVCLPLLEEYIDGELREAEAAPLSEHLVTCAACAHAFDSLTAEQEIYLRYDRELEISPMLWNEIAARTVEERKVVNTESRSSWREWLALPSLGWSFAGAMAMLIAVVALAVIYFQTTKQPKQQAINDKPPTSSPQKVVDNNVKNPETPIPDKTQDQLIAKDSRSQRVVPKSREVLTASSERKTIVTDQSDVLFSDVAYSQVEEKETLAHLESAQNLLRSVRNIEISEDDTDVDVTYEKALSRRLLNENVILRREAEMNGKFPTKTLLADLEPFLIDIANLPDKPAAEDLRVLKQRVQKTEIVAALQGY